MKFKNMFLILLKDDLLHACIFMIVFTIGFGITSVSGNSFSSLFAMGMTFCLAWIIKS